MNTHKKRKPKLRLSFVGGIVRYKIQCFFYEKKKYNTLSVGTLFMEAWKRKQATLAYQWDVDQFEENEPDRPQFYGTKQRLVCHFTKINLLFHTIPSFNNP